MGDRFYRQRDHLTIGNQPDRRIRDDRTPDYFLKHPELILKNSTTTKKKENPVPSLKNVLGIATAVKKDVIKPEKRVVSVEYVVKKGEPSWNDLIKSLMAK